MKRSVLLFAVIVCLSIAVPAWTCTTTLTGKKASADGSVMVSHSDDGLSDARLIYVPAMDHKPGSLAAGVLLPLRPGFQAPVGRK